MASFEKFRPKSFEELVGMEDIKTKVKEMADTKKFQHMLFVGNPGAGKTALAHVFANYVLGENKEYNFLELNTSNERGIETLRKTIIPFVKAKPVNSNYKILLLDEADSTTSELQSSLRRVMEQYNTTIFILSANYIHKIMKPIQSRCVPFIFKKYSKEEIEKIIRNVISKEGLLVNDEKVKLISETADGDARIAINMLFGNVESNVELFDFTKIPTDMLLMVRYTKGITQRGHHILFLYNLFEYFERNNILNAEIIKIFASVDNNIQNSGFPEVQLLYLILEIRKIGVKI